MEKGADYGNNMKTPVLLLALLPVLAVAGGPPPAAEQEIRHLMSHLETSGCRFNRNGTWYSAKEAVEHLNKKSDYLMKKGLVSSAEDFIVHAASESSVSRKPYQVQCGSSASMESNAWLKTELARYRAGRR
jgi:hypothetical protein